MEDILDRQESDLNEFEILSVQKFVIICLFSMGLYQVWWIYKVWRFFKFKSDFKIMPAARAVFSILFLVGLFGRIQEFSKSYGYTKSFYSVLCYIGFFGCNFISYLPDPYWMLSLFSMIFLIPALNSFNYGIKRSGDYKVVENGKYNYRQIGLVLVGATIIVLGLVGMYLEQGPL